MIKKILVSVFAVLFLFTAIPFSAGAQSSNNAVFFAQVMNMMEKVRDLQNQLSLRQGRATDVRSELRNMIMLTRELRVGMSGEDVKALQELLASDPAIYPERLVTGYFGPLTMRAVQRFQVKAGIPSVGIMNHETMWRINEILEDGVGPDGRIPPGLLTAPGIQTKFQEGFMERNRDRFRERNDGFCVLDDEEKAALIDLRAFERLLDILDEQISDGEWDDAMDTLEDLEGDENMVLAILEDEDLTDEANDFGDWMDLLRDAIEDEDEDGADELVDEIDDLIDEAESIIKGDCDDDDDDEDDDDEDDDDEDDEDDEDDDD